MKSSRRTFLKAAGAAITFPTIIPSHVLGADAPSKTIALGQIGCGRIARDMDMSGLMKCKGARYVAVADCDITRANLGKEFTKCEKVYQDYRELIADKSIDAVVISTPDHWHAQPAVEASFAKKDVYMQKPTSLTIDEGRCFAKAMALNKTVFQLGSQQRSTSQFQRACTLVRNGRLGKVHKIEIGLPGDPAGGKTDKMAVPENLNYDLWLGSTPDVYYTEDRVHPQKGFGRPGWLRCEQFGAGMITGWGSHHLDIAHWGMGWEAMGPVTIEGKGVFHTSGLWNVHGDYDITMTYPGDVKMHIWEKFPNGIRFIGEKGWIFVSRGGAKMTATDPTSPGKPLKSLDASDPKLLISDPASEPIKLNCWEGIHQQNWVNCIKTREESNVPAETAHRSCSACLVAHIGMKLGRKLTWDYKTETFVGDEEANKLLKREERAPYGVRRAFERLSK
jgi:predicted dehydrogenase